MKIKYRTQLGELLDYFHLTGDAAEIGVAEGRNAAILIQQPAITKLYLIDTWKQLNQTGDGSSPQSWHDNNFKEAKERMIPFNNKAIFLRGLSVDMIKKIPDKSLILTYVDGDHSYKGCLNDMSNIYPKLQNGAILAGHDYLNTVYGVKRAVDTFIKTIFDIEKRTLNINIIEEDDVSMSGFWFRK